MAIPRRDYRLKIQKDVADLINRANDGDPKSLWELQRRFDADPAVAAYVGDLAGLAEGLVAALAAGPKALALNDGILRQLDAMHEELAAECSTELERLLARRVAATWLALAAADAELARAHQAAASLGAAAIREADHRLDRAQARFLAASKALAQVRQICRLPRSPLSLVKTASSKSDRAQFRRPSTADPDLIPTDMN